MLAYIIGVSSGAFGVAGREERPLLVGILKKAQTSITKGVRFVQVDLESLSEFEEPDLERKIKKEVRERLGVELGIHSETKAFGVEAAELDSAILMEYERAHKRIVEILKNSKKIGAKYVLIHSSESTPFPFLERTLQSADLVDPWGSPFKEFLLKNEWLLFWLLGREDENVERDMIDCVMNLWETTPLENRKKITSIQITQALKERRIVPKNFIWMELLYGATLEEYLRRVVIDVVQTAEMRLMKKYEEMTEEERSDVHDRIRTNLEIAVRNRKNYLLDYVQSKSLHYGPERIAYYFIAKWMERSEEGKELWNKIIMATIEFFAKRAKQSVEEWSKKAGIDLNRLRIEDLRGKHELWVPAVSAMYIYGHLFPKNVKYEDPKKFLDGMFFAFESPMGGRGIEEWLRLGNPIQYYYLVEKANQDAGRDLFAVALDFEHMLSLRIEPGLVIDLLPELGGENVRVVHAGWPSTLAPAHLPIEVGSDQQRYLYEMYYKLRKKGFGIKKDAFIIFERGGPETFKQSIIALREIVDALEKDIPPEKLPLKFYGVSPEGMLSEERQRATIFAHRFEPLKGMLVVPEEEHTFLGRAATQKGVHPEKWKKEELR